MGQTLTNGIYLPNEGERNCYSGLAANWNAVDTLKGNYSLHAINVDIHVTSAEKETWNGKADASALTAHTGNTTIHVTSADKEAWDGHVADSVKHVTAEDKNKWDAVTGKADDSGVVHKAGAETITGEKIFSKYITSDGSSTGDEYSGNAKTNLWLMANRDTEELSGVLFDTFRQNTAQGTGTHILGFGIKENSIRYEGCRFSWIWDNNLNGYSFSIRPTYQGTNQAVEHCLGLSTDKWDKINGIEPSALSLPDLSAGIDISGYITNFSKGVNTYTPPGNGYILIRVRKTTLDHVSIRIQQNYGLINSSETADFSTWGIYLPVVAGNSVEVYIYADSLAGAYFFPCQGNNV